MKEYGFDGVDMDWEELQGKNAEYVALHKELRAELDKITPRPLLTAAVANWMFNRTTAQIHPYMDQLNNMSYWTRAVKNGAVDVTDIAKDMQGLVDKGLPKAKLGVGIGLGLRGKPCGGGLRSAGMHGQVPLCHRPGLRRRDDLGHREGREEVRGQAALPRGNRRFHPGCRPDAAGQGKERVRTLSLNNVP